MAEEEKARQEEIAVRQRVIRQTQRERRFREEEKASELAAGSESSGFASTESSVFSDPASLQGFRASAEERADVERAAEALFQSRLRGEPDINPLDIAEEDSEDEFNTPPSSPILGPSTSVGQPVDESGQPFIPLDPSVRLDPFGFPELPPLSEIEEAKQAERRLLPEETRLGLLRGELVEVPFAERVTPRLDAFLNAVGLGTLVVPEFREITQPEEKKAVEEQAAEVVGQRLGVTPENVRGVLERKIEEVPFNERELSILDRTLSSVGLGDLVEPEFRETKEEQERQRQEAMQRIAEERQRQENLPTSLESVLFRARAGIAPAEDFETTTFNKKIATNIIRNHLVGRRIDDEDGLKSQISNFIEDGLTQALPLNDPEKIRGVFATLGNSLTNLALEINDSPELFRVANEAAFSVLSTEAFETISASARDADIPDVLRLLFDRNLKSLSNRELSNRDILQISQEFNTELDNSPINRELEVLQDIDTSLNTIPNLTLRKVLKTQIRFRINKVKRDTVDPTTRLQNILVPTSSGRFTKVTRDARSSLADQIDRSVRDIDPRNEAAGINHIIATLNQISREHNIRTVIGGRSVPITVTLINPDGGLKTAEEVIRNINQISDGLRSNTVSFVHLPTISEGRPLSANTIAKQFSQDIERKRQTTRVRVEKKRLEDQPTRRNFGNISIVSNRSELSKELELVIPPNAMVKDLIKVAQSLLMDGGVLEDVDHKVILRIIANVTTIDEILRIFMMEQRKNLNNVVRILYKPNTHLGGSYLGGALSTIHNVPMNHQDFHHKAGIPIINNKRTILNTPLKNLYRFPHDEVKGGLIRFQHPNFLESSDLNSMHRDSGQQFRFQVEPFVEGEQFGGSIDDRVIRDIPFTSNIGITSRG